MSLESQIANETTMENLPENVLLEIMQYLSMKDRCRLRRVCNQWNRILCDHSLWRHVDLLDYHLPWNKLSQIAETYFSSSLLSLKIRGYGHKDEERAAARMKYDRMKEKLKATGVPSRKWPDEERAAARMKYYDRMKEKLKATGVPSEKWPDWLNKVNYSPRDPMLSRLAISYPNLQLLHLHDFKIDTVPFESLPPSITCLEIVYAVWQPRWMKDKQNHLPKLEHLSLDFCVAVEESDVADISGWKNLKYLSLGNCYKISPSFSHIAFSLRELEYLNLSSVQLDRNTIIFIVANLKKLKELCLADCRNLNDYDVDLIVKKLPVLNKLNISFCTDITMGGLKSLFLSKITELSVVGLTKLSEEEKQALKSGFSENFVLID